MNAEDLMVNDGGQGESVESLVALFPHLLAQLCAKSIFALVQKRLLSIVLFPAIHLNQIEMAQ